MAKRRSRKKLVRLACANGNSKRKGQNVCPVKGVLKSNSGEALGNRETKHSNTGILNSSISELTTVGKSMKGRKYVSRKFNKKSKVARRTKSIIHATAPEIETHDPEDSFLHTRIEDGMTCMDVECGPNQAVMYPSKLCLGSKGACIRYMNSWLTPNEFQLISGRETAKDWKRSIKHDGKSLKLLIVNGLIQMDKTKDRKKYKSTQKSKTISPEENIEVQDDQVTDGDEDKNNEIVSESVTRELSCEDGIKDSGANVLQLPLDANNEPSSDVKLAKKRRGRKPKKGKVRTKRDVTTPLNIDKPEPENEELAETGTTPEEQNIDTGVQTVEETCDRTSPVPHQGDDTDVKSDEEKRLDDFVKVLSLNKTPDKTHPTQISEEANNAPGLPKDMEMPVLKMEVNIEPPDLQIQGLPAEDAVNPFHATVTPPPTPPTDTPEPGHIINKQLDKSDTFQSGLCPVDEDVKTVINKQNAQKLSDVEMTPLANAGEAMEAKDLLLDALASAQTFKEQQQSQQERQSVIHVPKYRKLAHKQSSASNSNGSACPKDQTGVHTLTNSTDNKLCKIVREMKSAHIYKKNETDAGNSLGRVCASASITKHHGPSQRPGNYGYPSSASVGHTRLHRNSCTPSRGCVKDQEATGVSNYRNSLLMSQAHVSDGRLPFIQTPVTPQMFLALSHQYYQNMFMPPLFPFLPTTGEDLPGLQSDTTRQTPPTAPERKRKFSDSAKESECEAPLDLSMKKAKRDLETPPESRVVELINKRGEIGYTPCGDHNSESHYSRYGNKSTSNSLPPYLTFGNILNEYSYHRSDLKTPHCTLGNKNAKDKISRHPSCTCRYKQRDDIRTWCVDRVCAFLRNIDGCKPYMKTFHDQGINGRLLPYLTTQHLTRTLGMKVGPALSLQHAVDQLMKDNGKFHSCAVCGPDIDG